MSKFDLRIKAEQLRRSGKSINEISSLLHVSKSSASLWCQNVILTPYQKQVIQERMIVQGHRGRIKGAAKNHEKKIQSINYAKQWAEGLVKNTRNKEVLFSGVALYWAEGSKGRMSSFLFVNSDPAMVLFMYHWMQKFLNVTKIDFIATVYINEIHRQRTKNVLHFWSNLLDLPISQFSKPYFSKTLQKKKYQNSETYYGILRLGVKRSTLLKYKTLALIEEFKKYADVAQAVRASVS